MRRLAFVVLAVLAACDNPFASDPRLSGRWVGGSSTSDLTLDLTLTQAKDGRVQGSGVMTHTVWWFGEQVTASPAVSAAGVHDHPHVSLTLELSGGGVREVTGQIEGDSRWTGRICSSGGGCQPLDLNRR